MNGFVFSISRLGIICACACLWLGCKNDSSRTGQPQPADVAQHQVTPEFKSGPNGTEILRDLTARYATAKTYQDKAVLYLSYQLEGRSIQEPQRWSTVWSNQGQMASELFNGVLCADGKLLSCYIYDINTANLDDQHLLMPYDQRLPLNQLFRDSIANHFLGGYSELPLDETDLLAAPKLIPAPMSLLTNQVRNGWLQNPSKVERLPDETIDEKPCFVVRSLFDGMTSDVWIDAQSFTLVQMSLPLKLLAGEVVTSPEITDVVLLAKFHGAVIDGEIAESTFAVKSRPDSTPVRKFVALPETFPSELIGQPAPKFNLITQKRKPLDRLAFDGRVTTLLWVAGRPSFAAVGQLDDLAASLPANRFHFGSVYSDSELKSPGTGSIEVVNELATALKVANSAVYYDPQMAASTALKVKAIPSVIVLDGNSRIQFAKALSNKNWLKEVKAAVERVAAGDDVAGEMLGEYQRYLDSYRQQLATVSAADLLGPVDDSIDEPSTGHLVAGSLGGIRLRPEKIWINESFKKSGNVTALNVDRSEGKLPNEAAFLVFDGWRTVVEVDQSGETKTRVGLDLPDATAVNLIRVGTDENGRRLYAIFSALGQQVYLFDQEWKPRGVFPADITAKSRIRDCQLTDLNGDRISELVIAFEDEFGIQRVDLETLVGERISTAVATSIALHGNDIVIAGERKIGLLKTGLTNVEETELDFRRVAAIDAQNVCGLGVTSSGQWNAVGFDGQLKRNWTLSVGSQFFETEIEPIAVTRTATGELIWAIADTADSIHLVSGSGKWLGDFQSESQLGGIALATFNGKTQLIVSNESGIECWNLNLTANPMRPVSTQK